MDRDAPLIPPAKQGGNKRTADVQEIVNGLMYIRGTGCQWRDIPKDLAPRSTIHDYLDRWDYDGTLQRIHYELYGRWRELAERKASSTAAVIDSQNATKGGLHRSAWLRRGEEDQGQGMAYRRRYDEPVDADYRACGRHSGWR
jgi:transposase